MMDKNTSKLDVEFITTLSSLLNRSDLTELRLENGLTSIHLKRDQSERMGMAAEKTRPAELKQSVCEQANLLESQSAKETILSATVGILHLFNGELGFPRQVEAEELLATIHVGLLQLPVRAVKKSVIELAEIQEGQVVEYGTELFHYDSQI
jgi:biotin carboxyl carrier protein